MIHSSEINKVLQLSPIKLTRITVQFSNHDEHMLKFVVSSVYVLCLLILMAMVLVSCLYSAIRVVLINMFNELQVVLFQMVTRQRVKKDCPLWLSVPLKKGCILCQNIAYFLQDTGKYG